MTHPSQGVPMLYSWQNNHSTSTLCEQEKQLWKLAPTLPNKRTPASHHSPSDLTSDGKPSYQRIDLIKEVKGNNMSILYLHYGSLGYNCHTILWNDAIYHFGKAYQMCHVTINTMDKVRTRVQVQRKCCQDHLLVLHPILIGPKIIKLIHI